MFQSGHVSLTSADTYRRDSYCLARVFQNLPAPPKQYGVFDVFCDLQSFFQLENLGSHLEMRPDDRFLPQGKQIFPEICQVRPMPLTLELSARLQNTRQGICSDWKTLENQSAIYKHILALKEYSQRISFTAEEAFKIELLFHCLPYEKLLANSSL